MKHYTIQQPECSHYKSTKNTTANYCTRFCCLTQDKNDILVKYNQGLLHTKSAKVLAYILNDYRAVVLVYNKFSLALGQKI